MSNLSNLITSIVGGALGSIAVGFVRDQIILSSLDKIDQKLAENNKKMQDPEFFEAIKTNHGSEVALLFEEYVRRTKSEIKDIGITAQDLWIQFLSEAKSYLEKSKA